MRISRQKALAATLLLAVPALLYFGFRPLRADPFASALRDLGFFPVKPPSQLMALGSLYYYDTNSQRFIELCRVDEEKIKQYVKDAEGAEYQTSLSAHGSFLSSVKIYLSHDPNLKVGSSYDAAARFSLSDVHLSDISVEINKTIQDDLMSRPTCSTVVDSVLKIGGYVCQGQTILQATATYDLQEGGATSGTASASVGPQSTGKDVAKIVSVDSNTELHQAGDKWTTGVSLQYGVATNPLCLAPAHSRFVRRIPETQFALFLNYIKFAVIEPYFPSA